MRLLFNSLSAALPAVAITAVTNRAIPAFNAACIRFCVFVALCAISLRLVCLYSGGATYNAHANAPLNIDLAGDRFEMLRIDAATDSAKMIKVQAFRDRSDEFFVYHSMRKPWVGVSIVDDSESRITVLVNRSEPQPATGIRLWQDEFHHSVYQRLAIAHLYNSTASERV